jgi:cysteine desulfurase
MIYLDYNATTPVDERVLAEMLPFFTEHFGNASSNTHPLGWYAQGAIDKARQQVASFIGAESSEIIFTSGATEAINMALKGVFDAYQTKGNHIITCKTEHKAVLDTCAYLEEKGAVVTYLNVDREGRIDLDELKESLY